MSYLYKNLQYTPAMKNSGIQKEEPRGFSTSTLVIAIIAAEIIIYFALRFLFDS